ncbi:MAG: response regulator, partial [Methanolobus sp.]
DIDLHEIMEEVASLLSIRAKDRGLELICIADPDVSPNIKADPVRLKQILINLGGNAIKFTHKGEVVIRATLVSENTSNVSVRFSVKDTGIGIPEEKKSLLFEKFSQIDTSTTRNYGGTGLGLAISKQLVELMNGEIDVESEENRGSEFWFTVNFAKHSGTKDTEKQKANLEGVHALVVDDNATNREILVKLLSSWKMDVEEAVDAPSALQKLFKAHEEGNPFQMGLLDMQMPGMDGIFLGRIIKSDQDLNNISLIILSSAGEMPEHWKQNKDHFEECLTKPIKATELSSKLSTIFIDEQKVCETCTADEEKAPDELHDLNARILLVEDNVVNQHVAQSMLQKVGITADVANNGLEAIDALEMIDYDLVFMDIQMPEMDGMEACRHIRNPHSSVLNHDVPIIAMTAHAMKGDKESCLAAGMNDYISKPVNLKILSAKLDKWLEPVTGEKHDDTELTEKKGAPVFDRQSFLDNIMNDISMARQIIEIFQKNAPRQLRELKDAISAENMDSIVSSSHSLKGSSSSVGGLALSDISAEIEIQASERKLKPVMEILPELEKQYELC